LFKICERTDTQTCRHAHRNTSTGAEVNVVCNRVSIYCIDLEDHGKEHKDVQLVYDMYSHNSYERSKHLLSYNVQNILRLLLILRFFYIFCCFLINMLIRKQHQVTHSDGVKTFFRHRDICQDTCQDTRPNTRCRIMLRQNEIETSFKCLRHETLQDTSSKI